MNKIVLALVTTLSSVIGLAAEFSVKVINYTTQELILSPAGDENWGSINDFGKETSIPILGDAILKTSANRCSKSGIASLSITSKTYAGETFSVWQNYSGKTPTKNIKSVNKEEPCFDSSTISILSIGTSNNSLATTLNEDGTASIIIYPKGNLTKYCKNIHVENNFLYANCTDPMPEGVTDKELTLDYSNCKGDSEVNFTLYQGQNAKLECTPKSETALKSLNSSKQAHSSKLPSNHVPLQQSGILPWSSGGLKAMFK